MLLAYIAHRIGRKGGSFQNTFGYKRAEILAATTNVERVGGFLKSLAEVLQMAEGQTGFISRMESFYGNIMYTLLV